MTLLLLISSVNFAFVILCGDQHVAACHVFIGVLFLGLFIKKLKNGH
jgi:hypothetical protein